MYDSNNNTFMGMKVMISDDKLVKRSWKERLFTLPWRPFKKLKVIPSCVSKGKILQGGGFVFMRSETLEQIKKVERGQVKMRGGMFCHE